MSVTVASTVEK